MARSIKQGLQSGEIRFVREAGKQYTLNKKTGLWEEHEIPLKEPPQPPKSVIPKVRRVSDDND